MAYPIKRLILLLFIVSFATGTGIAMNFIQIQYAYQIFVKLAKIPTNFTEPSPCDTVNSTNDPEWQLRFDWVQSNTAQVSMIYSLVSGILGFLTIIPLGYLSDRKGRKLVILLTFAGVYIDLLISSIMTFCEWPVYVIYVASVCSGIAGNGLIALQTQIYTCLADIVMEQDVEQKEKPNEDDFFADPADDDLQMSVRHFCGSKRIMDAPRHRLVLIGSFDAAVGVSYAAASASVGDLISAGGFVLPSGLALGFATITWIFIFMLPADKHITSYNSSVQKNTQFDVREHKSGFMFHVKTFYSFLHPVTFLGVGVIFITSFTIYSDADVAILYLMGKPLCWDASRVGMFMGLRTGTSAIFTSVVFLSMAFIFHFNLESTNPSSSKEMLVVETEDDEKENHEKVDEKETKEEEDDNDDEKDAAITAIPMMTTPMSYRRALIIALATAIFLLMFSRLIFGFAWMTEYPVYDNIAWTALAIGVIAFYNPIMKAILTSSVPMDQQGRLLATNGFCEVTGMLLGTSLQPLFYSATLKSFPGAIFLFNASLLCLGLVFIGGMAYIILRKTPKMY